MKGWLVAGAGVAAAGLAVRRGLTRLPEPFDSPPGPVLTGTTEMPELPGPVRRYLEVVAPGLPPMTSAVVTGRMMMAVRGARVPGRWRFTHEVSRGYRHDMELTVFGRKFASGIETYVDGNATLDLPTGRIADVPSIDSASAQSMWGEYLWLPSVLAAGQWEAIDAQKARLLVAGSAPLVAWFDTETGLLQRFETLRWRDAGDAEPLPWVTRTIAWTRIGGIGVPAVSTVQWGDQSQPWLRLSLDAVTWNVPVVLD